MSLLEQAPTQGTSAQGTSAQGTATQGTSVGTTPRTWWRRNRALSLLALALVAALVLLALTTGVGRSGALDPGSYEQSGGRALATLLGQQGVDVTRTTDVPTTIAGASASTTVFVPVPDLLTSEEISELAGSGAHLVIAQADPRTVSLVDSDISLSGDLSDKGREPACSLDAAVRAGTARIGGYAFDVYGVTAQRCYGGALLVVPRDDLVLLGGGSVLANQHLADEGNAALGLALLGGNRDLRWLMPSPDRAALGDAQPRSLNDLLPGWVKVGALQLLVAAVVLGLWRARRLGRVVVEPLPIVVRAAETVEGRGRLYRAAGSRGTAAEALRSGARDRLGQRLGAGRHATPEVLVDLVAARTSRPPTDVQGLLYGPPPVDDAALVRLAADLDSLTVEVTGS